MSPNPGVDTRNYADLYPDIQGAISGVWRANHTAAFQGSLPKVKLLLANMGSQYASWSEAVDHIADNAAANHVVSVMGLGQSMDNTRAAAAKLARQAHLPVIGATVTGDTMNLDPDGKLNTGFFRTSPTNTYSVLAAAVHRQHRARPVEGRDPAGQHPRRRLHPDIGRRGRQGHAGGAPVPVHLARRADHRRVPQRPAAHPSSPT